MPRPTRFLTPLAFALAAACRREPPAKPAAPPPPPVTAPSAPALGVHVAAAAADTLHVRFTVTVHGSLQLGIRAPMFAMRPDSTLLLVTPADLLVNKGIGSAVIAAADSGVALAATPLDSLSAPAAGVRGPIVRFERPDSSRRLLLEASAATPEHTRQEARR